VTTYVVVVVVVVVVAAAAAAVVVVVLIFGCPYANKMSLVIDGIRQVQCLAVPDPGAGNGETPVAKTGIWVNHPL